MIENNLLSYLNIGLPEDILRMKLHGDFDGAVRLIDRKLSDPALPDPLRYCLMAEREMILRMPSDYPFTREDALKKIRIRIPDFTEDEFDHYLSIGQIRWIYVNGEMRIFDRFFESMCKSMPDFRKRTAVTLDGSESAGKGSRGDLRLNRAMEIMKEKGSLSNRIRIRASVKVKESAFTPGMFLRVHLPIPAACDQQSDIRIESVFPENAQIAPEDAPQRTVCWEETLKENHEFSVQYSYVHTAVWHDTESALKKSYPRIKLCLPVWNTRLQKLSCCTGIPVMDPALRLCMNLRQAYLTIYPSLPRTSSLPHTSAHLPQNSQKAVRLHSKKPEAFTTSLP